MLALTITVGKADVKASVFEDQTLVCTSDPKNSTRNLKNKKKYIFFKEERYKLILPNILQGEECIGKCFLGFIN